MSDLLLGGLITLAGSAVVQVVIVPWVTAQRRHRERWEDTIIELLSVVDLKYADAISRLRSSSSLVRAVRTRLAKFTTGGYDRRHRSASRTSTTPMRGLLMSS